MAIKDAIINGKSVKLKEREANKAEEFHKSRLAFAWINGELTYAPFRDSRDHQHWMMKDYGLTLEEYEKTPRGYIMPGRIQLFIGSNFAKLDQSTINEIMPDFGNLKNMHIRAFGNCRIDIYSGVKIGKIGEVWDPIYYLGSFGI